MKKYSNYSVEASQEIWSESNSIIFITLLLKLKKIHRQKLTQTAGSYFCCLRKVREKCIEVKVDFMNVQKIKSHKYQPSKEKQRSLLVLET